MSWDYIPNDGFIDTTKARAYTLHPRPLKPQTDEKIALRKLAKWACANHPITRIESKKLKQIGRPKKYA